METFSGELLQRDRSILDDVVQDRNHASPGAGTRSDLSGVKDVRFSSLVDHWPAWASCNSMARSVLLMAIPHFLQRFSRPWSAMCQSTHQLNRTTLSASTPAFPMETTAYA